MLSAMLLGLAFDIAATAAMDEHKTPPFSVTACAVGDPYQFTKTTCTIELHNHGDKPLHVAQILARLPGDDAEPKSLTIPSNGVAYVQAHVNARERVGLDFHPFAFFLDGAKEPARSIYVAAYVQSILDQPRPTIDFGVIRIGKDAFPITREISLTSREVADLRIERVDAAPDWLEVKIEADRRTIKVSLKDTVPWGLTRDGAAFIKLALNAQMQTQVWVEVKAQAIGEVAPDSDPYQLGEMRNVGKHEFLIRISSLDGKDFRTGKLTLTGIDGATKMLDCTPKAAGCRLVRLTISNDQPLGKVVGVLDIDLPDLRRTLPINLFGIMLSPSTKIHDLNEAIQSQGSTPSPVVNDLDLGKALVRAVKENPPPPAGNGPLLRWSAAHQTRVYGYVIYRSESEQGPMMRVNKGVIPVIKEGGDVSGDYQWRDNTAVSGHAYWYQIGMLLRDGTKEDLSGRQKVVAK